MAAPDFEDLITIIRNSASTADQKKVAAGTIALRLLRAQATGGSIGDMNNSFDSALTGTGVSAFGTLTANIQAAVSGL